MVSVLHPMNANKYFLEGDVYVEVKLPSMTGVVV
jgi:hypothetical protein